MNYWLRGDKEAPPALKFAWWRNESVAEEYKRAKSQIAMKNGDNILGNVLKGIYDCPN